VIAGASVAGSVANGAFAARSASGPIADLDLALARLAVAAELLGIEFYTQAIASKEFQGAELNYLKKAQFNEQEHLGAVSEILTGTGQTASTADDFTFTFPKGTFESSASIARFGEALETVFVQSYLGAVSQFAAPDLKVTAARIAANEAQHQSVFADFATGRPVGVSFPAASDYATISDAVGAYVS
jgi:rubrerythrin